jgi:hypothetical protein
LSPSESLELQRAETRWESRPFDSYAFEVRVGCFCPPVLNEWSRVEVVNEAVTRVVTLASGTEVRPEERAFFPTVERLFDNIRNASREGWVKDIDVEFDAVLGYPTSIDFIPKPNILDAGALYELRNASALP